MGRFLEVENVAAEIRRLIMRRRLSRACHSTQTRTQRTKNEEQLKQLNRHVLTVPRDVGVSSARPRPVHIVS